MAANELVNERLAELASDRWMMPLQDDACIQCDEYAPYYVDGMCRECWEANN